MTLKYFEEKKMDQTLENSKFIDIKSHLLQNSLVKHYNATEFLSEDSYNF